MTALVGRHLCRPEGFRSDTLCESRPIDLQILEYPLNIIARYRERDAFDPVDWIDFGVTRIAVLRDAFLHPATPRIVAGKDQDKGAAVVSHQARELGRPHLGVVDGIANEAGPIVRKSEPARGISTRDYRGSLVLIFAGYN